MCQLWALIFGSVMPWDAIDSPVRLWIGVCWNVDGIYGAFLLELKQRCEKKRDSDKNLALKD